MNLTLSVESVERLLGRPATGRWAGRPVAVVVHAGPRRAHGRVIHGAWDPLLQRVELFGADQRSDEQLLQTLLHELAHAGGAESEAQADAVAREALENVADGVGVAIVARLRQAAFDRSASGRENPDA
jgi:hypothetical protein